MSFTRVHHTSVCDICSCNVCLYNVANIDADMKYVYVFYIMGLTNGILRIFISMYYHIYIDIYSVIPPANEGYKLHMF
jgi:hypothetical protein